MPESRPVRRVELQALVHATEDHGKVIKAIHNLFPVGAEIPPYSEVALEGYYRDSITTLRLEVKNRKPATDLFNNIIRGLNSLDLDALLDELPQRIEAKNLYIRLDKQKAYQGKIALNTHDAVRVKVSLNLPHKADPVEYMREYIEGLS